MTFKVSFSSCYGLPNNDFFVEKMKTVGTVKPSIPDVKGTETTWIQVITDKNGSLVTTYPVSAPKKYFHF